MRSLFKSGNLKPRNLFGEIASFLSAILGGICVFEATASADTASFGYSLDTGGVAPYTIKFAGLEFSGTAIGYCGLGFSQYSSGGASVDLQPMSVYQCSVTTYNDTFCDVMFNISAPCYDVYIDGNNRSSSYPNWRNGYLMGMGPNVSAFNLIVQLMPNETTLPIAAWDVSPSKDGNYSLPADGTSTAVGTFINTDTATYPVTFVFQGDSKGCTLSNSASQVFLTAGTNYGTVQVKAQTSDPTSCLMKDFTFNLIDPTACQECADNVCNMPRVNSVDVRLALGSSAWPGPAYLQIKSEIPSLALGTPAMLQCPFKRFDLEIITNSLGWLRQVRSSDRIIDIATNSATSYSLKFYRPGDAAGVTNGLYLFSNSSGPVAPFETITMSLVGGDTNHFQYYDSLSPAPADYYWQNGGWTLATGFGARSESVVVTTNGATYTKSRVIRNGQGTINYQATETWQPTAYGDRLLGKTTGSGTSALTETNTYDTKGRLLQSIHSDGSWDIYTYDLSGRQIGHYSPFGNSTPTTNASLCRYTAMTYDNSVVAGSGDDASFGFHTPRRVVHYVAGQEVGRNYTVIKSGERDEIQCVAPGAAWNASGNLVTTNILHTNYRRYGQPKTILNPDGTAQIISEYTTGSGSEKVTTSGASNGSGGVSDGTVDHVWMDRFGRTTMRQVSDVLSGIVLSQENYSYDVSGHLTNTAYLDGTSVRQTYDCCNPDSRIDRDGTVTSFGYDVLKRLQTTYANGILTSNTFDAAGNVISTTRYGVNGTAITLSSSTYDDAGRLTSSTDALNQTTYYTNYFDGSGQLVKQTKYPDSSTRIETYAKDGSLQSVTGTAVLGVRYVYGVEIPSGESVNRAYTKEIKLNANGTDSGEWTKTYTDMLGRAYKSVNADNSMSQSFYNSVGQLSKQVDPDGVTMLYQYNAKGQVVYTAVDMNTNGVIDFSGTDRISSTMNDVTTDNGVNVNRSRTWVWNVSGSSTSNLVSQAETSVSGLQSWNILFNSGVGVTNFTSTSYNPAQGYRVVTTMAPDGSSSTSTYLYGRLISTTQSDANSMQTGQNTYGYDAHGRQNTMTDARNGTTTYQFNNADQVTSITTPSPGGPGGTPQTTTSFLDSMGRVYKTTLPDNTSVTNAYYTNGLLQVTYGSRTYPVQYTYDYAGRMKTMTTWTNYATSGGAAVTTWNYDGSRGFMTNKAYADGKGPSYSYTAAGRLKTRIWARGVGTTNVYDGAGGLLKVNYSGATPSVANTYDRLGRVVSVVSGGVTNALAYNDANLLLSETYSGGPLNGLSVTNGYDQFLRRTNLTAKAAAVLSRAVYGYDAASRLSTVSDGVNTAVYSYLANSPLVGQILFQSNSVTRMTTTKQYDYLNRLTQISSQPAGSGASPLAFNYNYNAANQRTTVTNTDNSYWVYQYDSLGQVISGKKYWSDGTPVAGQQFTYDFDDIGNRKSTAAGGDALGANLRSAGYTNNALNQITGRTVPGYVTVLGSANANSTVTVNLQRALRYNDYFAAELAVTNTSAARFQIFTNLAVLNNGTNKDIIATNIGGMLLAKTPQLFQYDADGNLTNDGLFSYSWDAENRMTNVTSLASAPTNAAVQEAWSYLPDGRWSQVIISTWKKGPKQNDPWAYYTVATNKFLWDGQVLAAEVAPNGSLIRSYMRGLDLSGSIQGAGGVGGLLAVSYTGTATTNCFVAFDGNGNVAALVNAADGTTVANYEYDPFGQTLRMTGPMAEVNPIRFSTQWADDYTGDIKYLYRNYSASTGRWLSRDPIQEQGGLNLYAFVANDPIRFWDRFGLDPVGDWISGIYWHAWWWNIPFWSPNPALQRRDDGIMNTMGQKTSRQMDSFYFKLAREEALKGTVTTSWKTIQIAEGPTGVEWSIQKESWMSFHEVGFWLNVANPGVSSLSGGTFDARLVCDKSGKVTGLEIRNTKGKFRWFDRIDNNPNRNDGFWFWLFETGNQIPEWLTNAAFDVQIDWGDNRQDIRRLE